MNFAKLLYAPIAFIEWCAWTAHFYLSHERVPVMSEQLSEEPVSLEDAFALIARYIEKNGRQWKFPLLEEVEHCVLGRERDFTDHIWVLDESRFWRMFRPSDGAMSPGLDISLRGIKNGAYQDFLSENRGRHARCHVYLIKHEYRQVTKRA